MPQGLWQKCPGCSEVVHEIELAQNQRVCPRCDYHFAQSAKERIENLLDRKVSSSVMPTCVLWTRCDFTEWPHTKIDLRKYQDVTGLTDAVISGHGMIEGVLK